jgi:predicted nuclease of predicted toxin-antitoxin system
MTSSDQPIFFVDWCLGKTVVNALKATGGSENFIHHSEVFKQQSIPDAEWLLVAGENGWGVLTKDEAIGRNEVELRAIARANVKVFCLASGNLTRQEMADLFVHMLEKLKNFAQNYPSPFIAKIYKNYSIKLWRSQAELLERL